MADTDTELGREYWRLTVQDLPEILALGVGEEGGPDDPPTFRVLDAPDRVALPTRVPLHIGDPRDGLDGFREPDGRGGDLLGDHPARRIPTLLRYAFGFSRAVLGPTSPRHWPYHRFVASARCFYPTEMYLWLPGEGPAGARAGLHHYDPLHHALALVHPGDHRALLGRALGADLDGAAAAILLTSRFWKNAFRYRHYAYRLCTQEAGLVAGNVLTVAGALGLRGHVHYQFLDRVLGTLLRLEEDEETAMAVVPLYPRRGDEPRPVRPSRERRTADALLADIAPGSPLRSAGPPSGPVDQWSWVVGMDRACRLDDTGDMARLPSEGGPVPDRGGRSASVADGGRASAGDTQLLPEAAGPVDLAAALYARSSGPLLFNPLPTSIGTVALARVLRHALHPYTCDSGDAPFVRCFVVAHTVEGVAPGAYELADDGRALRRVSDRPVAELLETLEVTPPSVNVRSATAVLYLVGDHRRAQHHLGDRSYRVLTQDAGVVAQRLSVMAAAEGLAARIHNGIPVAAVERALGLPERDHALLFQLVLGRRRVTGQCEPSIVF